MNSKLELEKIREEARFYCYGSATAINVQREKDQSLQNSLDITIEQSKNWKEFLDLSYDQLVEYTVNRVRKKINNKNFDQNQLNNIGWEIGMICYVWSNSLPICKGNFTGIFIDTWTKYFSE